jgi:hypothetical protein
MIFLKSYFPQLLIIIISFILMIVAKKNNKSYNKFLIVIGIAILYIVVFEFFIKNI